MANRTLEDLEKTYLSDSSIEEFDSLLESSARKSRIRWAVSCAASLAVVLALGMTIRHYNGVEAGQDITTVELMETIGALVDNDLDEINSVNAKPGKKGIVVTAKFRNGMTRTYLMKRGSDGSSIELTAQN